MADIMTAFNASEGADGRFILLSRWVEEHTPEAVTGITAASEDASFRRYFRVRHRTGTLIAMDAPPEREAMAPWLDVAGRLADAGVRAPRIVAADERLGLALISDLGSETYLQALDAGADADRLYGDAIHTLVRIQGALVCDGLPAYDEALLRREVALFHDWLLERHLGIRLAGADASAWRETVDFVVESALAQPCVFVHRDYHSRNLMIGPPGAPGVIDFQDACVGPITYDLVSLLKDCYVSWPRERTDAWLRMYLDLARQTALGSILGDRDDGAWRRAFDVMGVQRHLKASGIFARLWHRDGKAGYLGDVPRTLGYITACEDHDGALAWLQELVRDRVLPALAERAG